MVAQLLHKFTVLSGTQNSLSFVQFLSIGLYSGPHEPAYTLTDCSRLYLLSDLFSGEYPAVILAAHPILLHLISLILFSEKYALQNFSLCRFFSILSLFQSKIFLLPLFYLTKDRVCVCCMFASIQFPLNIFLQAASKDFGFQKGCNRMPHVIRRRITHIMVTQIWPTSNH